MAANFTSSPIRRARMGVEIWLDLLPESARLNAKLALENLCEAAEREVSQAYHDGDIHCRDAQRAEDARAPSESEPSNVTVIDPGQAPSQQMEGRIDEPETTPDLTAAHHRYLPVVRRGPCAVSSWYVELPGGRQISLSNDEWKAARPIAGDAKPERKWQSRRHLGCFKMFCDGNPLPNIMIAFGASYDDMVEAEAISTIIERALNGSSLVNPIAQQKAIDFCNWLFGYTGAIDVMLLTDEQVKEIRRQVVAIVKELDGSEPG